MKSKSIFQFLKFALVGIANTLVDWLVFYALIYFIIPDDRLLAKAISFIIAATNSFVLNSIWTFRSEFFSGLKDKGLKFYQISIYFTRFFAVSIVGFAINYLTFKSVISFVSDSSFANYSNIFGLFFASGAALVWNFFINKIWTYKNDGVKDLSETERKEKISNFKYNLVAGLLLLIFSTISFFLIKNDSAIVDEVAHIPAGYSYVKFHDYRLNPEHPPLAKFVAGVPLAFLNISDPRDDWSWSGINQWDNGWYMLYRSGNNADQILFWSRLPMLLLTVLLGLLIYIWGSEAFGKKAGLFALFLYTFSPEILAHGHFVTTDVAAALGFTFAIYAFWKFTEKGGMKYLLFAGVALGVAELLKFSAFLLYPMFFVLIIARSFYDKKEKNISYFSALFRNLGSLILISAISLVVVWLVYIPMVWSTPAEVEKQLILNNLTNGSGSLVFRNFLYNFVGNPFSRAFGHFLLGMMLVFGRVAGGNSTFILGHFSDKSISWFFPVAWLIKTPATILFLTFASVIYAFIRKIKKPSESWLVWILIVPIIFYWLISIAGSLNIGTRHLIPTLPLLYLFIGLVFSKIINSKSLASSIGVIIVVISLATPIVLRYPNYLGYFNLFTTGTSGYKMMVDSSLDWGQDLKRLGIYLKENKIENPKIDYFGGGVPKYYIPDAVTWRSGFGPSSGWFAISATYYQMSKLQGKEGGKWSYDWLDDYQPVAIVGSSMLIFHITPEDLINNPPKSPYPITSYDIAIDDQDVGL